MWSHHTSPKMGTPTTKMGTLHVSNAENLLPSCMQSNKSNPNWNLSWFVAIFDWIHLRDSWAAGAVNIVRPEHNATYSLTSSQTVHQGLMPANLWHSLTWIFGFWQWEKPLSLHSKESFIPSQWPNCRYDSILTKAWSTDGGTSLPDRPQLSQPVLAGLFIIQQFAQLCVVPCLEPFGVYWWIWKKQSLHHYIFLKPDEVIQVMQGLVRQVFNHVQLFKAKPIKQPHYSFGTNHGEFPAHTQLVASDLPSLALLLLP